jgi:MSHA biogenesis protein MshL
LNNQRAVIRVGTEDTIFVRNAAQSGAGYSPRAINLGVILDVVPQINVNGNVIMSVHTNVTKKAGERVSPDGLSRAPVVDVRESSNVVMARNGQTVVIGGLLGRGKNPKKEPATAAPIFGGLFHEELTTYEKSELLILLTPQIMVGDAIDDRLRIEEKRLKRFGVTRQSQKMKTSLEGK